MNHLTDKDIDVISWWCITNGTKTWRQFARLVLRCAADPEFMMELRAAKESGIMPVITGKDIPGVEGN